MMSNVFLLVIAIVSISYVNGALKEFGDNCDSTKDTCNKNGESQLYCPPGDNQQCVCNVDTTPPRTPMQPGDDCLRKKFVGQKCSNDDECEAGKGCKVGFYQRLRKKTCDGSQTTINPIDYGGMCEPGKGMCVINGAVNMFCYADPVMSYCQCINNTRPPVTYGRDCIPMQPEGEPCEGNIMNECLPGLKCLGENPKLCRPEGWVPGGDGDGAGGNGNGTEHVDIVNRTCIEEPGVPSFDLPEGICNKRNDSCKHELVLLSNGKSILCDTETEGGGWILVQRRQDFQNGSTSAFVFQDYQAYREGFGEMGKEFWLGLETMHRFCPPGKPCQMRTEYIVADGSEEYVMSKDVTFGGAWDNYKIHLAKDSSSGSVVPMEKLNGVEFAARGRSGDIPDCVNSEGGWWHTKKCDEPSLNTQESSQFQYSEIMLRRVLGEPNCEDTGSSCAIYGRGGCVDDPRFQTACKKYCGLC